MPKGRAPGEKGDLRRRAPGGDTGPVAVEHPRDQKHLRREGDWAASLQRVEEALSLWRSREGYTHAVLRHADIETLSDDFYELMEHIGTHDPGAVQSAVRLVTEHLREIVEMESIKLGSIF